MKTLYILVGLQVGLVVSSLNGSEAALRIYPAVELEFETDINNLYQLESSSNLVEWVTTGSVVEGTGGTVNLFLSIKNDRGKFFRFKSVDATPGLVAYYPLNNSASDWSTNKNHGIASNLISATNRFGRPNAAYKFLGQVDSFIRVPDSPSLDITQQVTLTAWINFEVGGTFSPRVVNKNTYDLATASAPLSSRRVGFTVHTPDEHLLLTRNAILQAGVWQFLACTYDGSFSRVYLDGELVSEGENTGEIRVNDFDLNIGRNAQNASDHYKGLIDEVRIYNRAISPEEIVDLYHKID